MLEGHDVISHILTPFDRFIFVIRNAFIGSRLIININNQAKTTAPPPISHGGPLSEEVITWRMPYAQVSAEWGPEWGHHPGRYHRQTWCPDTHPKDIRRTTDLVENNDTNQRGVWMQPARAHSHGMQPARAHSHGMQPARAHSHGMQPARAHSHGMQPARAHSHGMQPARAHSHGMQPARAHSHGMQPARAHSHGMQPARAHSHGMQPARAHSHGMQPARAHSQRCRL